MLQRVAKRRASVVDLNLSLCFPEKSEAERKDLARKTFESLGVMMFEVTSMAFGREEEIVARGKVWGESDLQDAVNEGNGVILIGVHLNAMEAAAAIMHRHGFQFSAVTRRQRNVAIDGFLEKRRKARFGEHNIYDLSQIRKAVRDLRKNRLNLWLAADQDMGRRGTVIAPFFGIEASTVQTPARIASLWKDDNPPALVLMSQYRDEKDRRVHVKFARINDLPLDNLCEASTCLNRHIEAVIREHPEQWFWVHKRFKTLPDGKRREY